MQHTQHQMKNDNENENERKREMFIENSKELPISKALNTINIKTIERIDWQKQSQLTMQNENQIKNWKPCICLKQND